MDQEDMPDSPDDQAFLDYNLSSLARLLGSSSVLFDRLTASQLK